MKTSVAKAGFGVGVLTPWSGWPSIGWSTQRVRFAGRRMAAHLEVRRLATIAIWSALAVAALAPVVMVALVTGPYRPMVVNTESMAPALEVGDVIVNEVVSPADLRPGDIVAYSDQMREGAVITERVLDVQYTGSTYDVTTASDATGRQSAWSIDDTSKVGRVAYRVPALGRLLAIPNGFVGGALLVALGVLLVGLVAHPLRLRL
jgi:signal peptidase I